MSDLMRPWWGDAERRGRGSSLNSLQDQLTRLFTDPFGWLTRSDPWGSGLEVHEDPDGWIVEVRLPGVAPEEVEIEVAERELAIRARHAEAEAEAGERPATGPVRGSRSDFSYRLTLPAATDLDRIDATMDHGLLTVRLPRSGGIKPRRVTVGSGARPAGAGGGTAGGGQAGGGTAGGGTAGGGAGAGAPGADQQSGQGGGAAGWPHTPNPAPDPSTPPEQALNPS
jgi:HSP20 family protein